MSCRRCPHHVRHGQIDSTTKGISFKNVCGLVLKQSIRIDEKDGKKTQVFEPSSGDDVCVHYPFPQIFDYVECQVYKDFFKTAGQRNDVIPTKDFQYSEALNGISITDMELL